MSPSMENPDAGQGSVLLDIGGDVGALVVTMPAGLVCVEFEVRPLGAPDLLHNAHGHGHYPHVEVVLRPTADGAVPSLVFPELVEGRYELYVKETHDVELVADVTGGEVTTTAWPR